MRYINNLMLAFFFSGTICTASSVCAMYGVFHRPVMQQTSQQPVMQQTSQQPVMQQISQQPMQDRYPSVNVNGDLVVPNSVIDISGNAFANNIQLKEIVIPDHIKRIGEASFSNCANVTSIQLGTGLREIDDNAFAGITKVRDLIIPESVTRIGKNALSGMKLYSLWFCNTNSCSVEMDGCYTAQYTNYKRGNTGATNICKKPSQNSANAGTTGAANIGKKPNQNHANSGTFGATGGQAKHDTSATQSIQLKELKIPFGLTSIDYMQFYGDESEKVVIYNRIQSIGKWALSNCANLKEIVVYSADIGECVFYNCPQVTKIYIGPGVTSIGDYSFSIKDEGNNSGLSNICLPDSLVNIGSQCFCYLNAVTKVSLGTNLTSIGNCFMYGNDKCRFTVRDGAGKARVKQLLKNAGIPDNRINK